jgi:hypothetical protein
MLADVRWAAICLLAAGLVCGAAAAAGGAAAHAFCPGIDGRVSFPRAGKVHVLSLLDCTVSTAGKAAAASLAGVRTNGAHAGVQKIWAHGRLVFSRHEDGPAVPLSLSPDGRWLVFAIDPMSSGSIMADGLDLLIVSTQGGALHHLGVALAYPDYLAWCGGRLVYVQGRDRVAIHAKRLLVASPPAWRAHSLWPAPGLSFASPACDPARASVAVLVQRSSTDARFFDTRWQLWRVGLDGSRTLLDRPPTGSADESPLWAPDGGALAFVRERKGQGQLAVLVGRDIYGPLAELGYSLGFYGHHDWSLQWRR